MQKPKHEIETFVGSKFQREGKHIAFIDLETTGLDRNASILEFSCLVTPPHASRMVDLSQCAYIRGIVCSFGWRARTEQIVIDMHEKSGLAGVLDTYGDDAPNRKEVDALVLGFLLGLGIAPKTLTPAGFSIHFDLGYIKRDMPKLEEFLSHRVIDVSTIKTVIRSWCKESFKVPGSGASGHRALPDCIDAARELFWLRDYVFHSEGFLELLDGAIKESTGE